MTTTMKQAEQLTSALMVCKAIADAIQQLGEVPSGTLYAHVMGKMDMPTYERVIATVVSAGLVEKRGDLLVWKGGRL